MRKLIPLAALLAAVPMLGGCIAYSLASTAVDVTTGVAGAAVDVTVGAVDAVTPDGDGEDDEDKKDD
jgi:hypothetical protein